MQRLPSAIDDGTRYRNTFMPADRSLWINSSDRSGIADRVPTFEQYLRPPSPEVQQQVALELVDSARDHLRRYPASCSARKNRESAFDELRSVNVEHFNMTPDQTDAAFRTLEDYVFETLVYDNSITCCWNSSTAAMYDIVMDYNYGLTASSQEAACLPPLVFMARDRSAENDGYDIFREHAQQLGRLNEWVAWSEDEPCPQATTLITDTIDPVNAVPYCQLNTISAASEGACGDAPIDTPVTLTTGQRDGLQICTAESDYFQFTGFGNATLTLTSGAGIANLDVSVFDEFNNYIAGSSDDTDTFTVNFEMGSEDLDDFEQADETVIIQVYAVGGQEERSYTLSLELN